MVTEITQNGQSLYLHTAWADDTDGSGFSLTEYEGALYVGSYADLQSMDAQDPDRYEWTAIEESEDEEASVYDDVIEDVLEQNADLQSELITTGEQIEGTQNTSDVGLGNFNELVGTNHGTAGWTASEGLILSDQTDSLYQETDDPVDYLIVTCQNAGANWIAFTADQLRNKLAEDTADNAYTLSLDIKMSELFVIRPPSVQDVDGKYPQIIFDAIDNSPGEEQEEIITEDLWMHHSSTAEVINADDAPVPVSEQVFFMDLSEMPQGAVLSIANLKIEGGALATPWRMSNDEIEATAREALVTANAVQERADSGEFDGEDAIVLKVSSSHGIVFKSNQVSTLLSVCIYYGARIIETGAALRQAMGEEAYLKWEYRGWGDEEWSELSRADERLSDQGFQLVLGPEDVSTKIDFRCSLCS